MRKVSLGSLVELLPAVNFASRAFAAAGNVWGPRINPDHQLFHVLSGEALVRIGSQTVRLGAGECSLYSSAAPHYIEALTKLRFYSVHFHWNRLQPEPEHPGFRIRPCNEDELRRWDARFELTDPGSPPLPVPGRMVAPELEPMLARLVEEYRGTRPGYALMLRSAMLELLVVLARLLRERSEPAANSRIAPALAAIVEQPEEAWAVSELARRCGYHPIHFAKRFKEETGMTPKQYLIDERIKRAKRLLLEGDSIERVSERLGYASVHYFSNNFKKQTGLSPSQFRQRE